MAAVEAERLRVASGADWDEGYLPPDWRPLRPLQFLGEWLRANSNTGMLQKVGRLYKLNQVGPTA